MADSLIGKKFGKLTVVEQAPNKKGRTQWVCECECGGATVVSRNALVTGGIKSCGCARTEAARNAHGKVDLVGQRFGQLVVEEFAGYEDGRGQWLCRCDCNNTVVVHTSALKSGNTQSCGHTIDLTGQVFGELTVLGFDHRPEGKESYWRCLCSCGQETVVAVTNLQRGNVKSCGKCDLINFVGQTFGRLTVESFAYSHPGKGTFWHCKCSCGNSIIVPRSYLVRGNTASCGCLWKDRITTHGMYKSPEYNVWSSMKARCENPNVKAYPLYGGRGIRVCDEWVESFESFYEYMGPRPENTTIDRIDVDGNYEPGNCRWATDTEQSRNRRTNRLITINGETKCVTEWAEQYNMRPNVLHRRLDNGWSVEDAVFKPVNTHKKKDDNNED